ncbi:hypothetical protein RIF29_33146 [Crotalaria pallida]|uniref:Uncharacterized protein n=1 Tax=Crotalaria pallida TaxID=3830 RepID=A0AAN9E9P5_CROPI
MLKRIAHSLGLVEQSDKKNRLKGSKASSPDLSSHYSKAFLVRIIHLGGQQEVYKHAIPASTLMTKYPGLCVARPEVFKIPHQSVLWEGELLLPGHKYFLISSKQVEKLKLRHSEEGETEEPNGVVSKEILDRKTGSPGGHKYKENGKQKVPNGIAGQEISETPTTLSPGGGQRHKEKGKMKEPNGCAGQEMLETRSTLSPTGCKSQEKSKVEEVKEPDSKMDRSSDGGVGEESFCYAKDFYDSKDKWTRSSRRKVIKGKKPFVPPLPNGRPYRILGWQPSLPTVKELSP